MHDLGRAVIYITHWEIIFSSENTESQNVGCIGYHCMRIVYAPRVITYILMFGMVCWFGQQCATFIHQNPPCSLTEEHSYCHQDMPRNWAVTWFPNKKIHSNTNCSWSGWRLAMEDFQFFLISQRAVWKKKKKKLNGFSYPHKQSECRNQCTSGHMVADPFWAAHSGLFKGTPCLAGWG